MKKSKKNSCKQSNNMNCNDKLNCNNSCSNSNNVNSLEKEQSNQNN